jgi:hypothetical protein
MRARVLMGGATALLVALAGVAGAQGKSQAKSEKPAKANKQTDAFGPKGQERKELKGLYTDGDRRAWEEALSRSSVRGTDLPPGIRKNLERGKPLPPGIAKKRVPDDVYRRLPATARSTEGYEDIIVGRDVVRTDKMGKVVDILSGIVIR